MFIVYSLIYGITSYQILQQKGKVSENMVVSVFFWLRN